MNSRFNIFLDYFDPKASHCRRKSIYVARSVQGYPQQRDTRVEAAWILECSKTSFTQLQFARHVTPCSVGHGVTTRRWFCCLFTIWGAAKPRRTSEIESRKGGREWHGSERRYIAERERKNGSFLARAGDN